MSISEAKYIAANAIEAVIDDAVTIVPDDMANRHRRMLAEWEAGGGVIEPYVPPPAPVPQSMSPLQARRALRAAGLKAAVDAYVATLPEEEQEAWEYATEVRRDNEVIAAGAAALGLSAEQVDDIFRLGPTL